VAVAALLVQAGALFSFLPQTIALYIAPLGVIFQITRFEGGINASVRDLRARIHKRTRSKAMVGPTHLDKGTAAPSEVSGVRLPVAIGTLMVVAGFGAIGLAGKTRATRASSGSRTSTSSPAALAGWV
jgi:hypothetical protein